MILAHLKEHYDTHIASSAGSIVSLFNGAGIVNSLIVGIMLFVATNLLKKIFPKIFK